jgi:hypothetical protein
LRLGRYSITSRGPSEGKTGESKRGKGEWEMEIELEYEEGPDGMLYPKLDMPEPRPTGRWGREAMTFMTKHRRPQVDKMIIDGTWNDYLADLNETFVERLETMMEELLKAYPAPDKATRQMEWVGHMNNLRFQAEATIRRELIYTEE